MAKTHNIYIDQGADRKFCLIYEYVENKTPVDITGFTAEMDIKKGRNVVHTLKEPTQLEIVPTLGVINVHFLVADTDALAAFGPCLKYDLLLTSPDFTKRLIEGNIFINKKMTTI